jgi:type I restriction enzyme S subunit
VSGARKEQGGTSLPRFKPYPAYKDPGVELLGEIPAHWSVRRLKSLASLNPESLAEDTDPSMEMVYVDIGGVDSLGRIVERESLTFTSAPSRARRLVRGGDVIVSTVRTYLRAIAPVNDPEPNLVVSTGFAVVRPADDLTTDYAAFALRAPYFVERVVANSKGVSFPAINESEMATYSLAVPPAREQRAIAGFLDRETARIDALVAKKERLIELLQEKRTALITRAVTRGLDPNVPMKDSGVEWLGEIPAHWEVKPFTKYVVEKSDYRGKTPEKVASGMFLVTARNVRMGLIDYECSQEFVAQDEYDEIMRRGLPRKGDVLFTTEAPLGNVALIDREDVALAQRIIRFRMNAKHFDSRFTLFGMMSDYFQAQLLCLSTGSTAEGLKASKLPLLRLVAPPLTDQYVIVELLDRETARIDTLVAKVRDAIGRLKELRTALISAAVTGKIDVREAGIS